MRLDTLLYPTLCQQIAQLCHALKSGAKGGPPMPQGTAGGLADSTVKKTKERVEGESTKRARQPCTVIVHACTIHVFNPPPATVYLAYVAQVRPNRAPELADLADTDTFRDFLDHMQVGDATERSLLPSLPHSLTHSLTSSSRPRGRPVRPTSCNMLRPL